MKSVHPALWVLFLSAAFAVASTAWFVTRPAERARETPLNYEAGFGNDENRKADEQPLPSGWEWAPPPIQPRGSGWLYEVFTPPNIFYDSVRGEFIAAEASPSEAAGEAALFAGIELLEVRRASFPIQLKGYVGSASAWLGAFENRETGEVHLLGEGGRIPGTGFTVEQIVVRSEADGVAFASGAIGGADAIIGNAEGDEVIELRSGEIAFSGRVKAVFRIPDGANTRLESEEGGAFETEQGSFRIERVWTDPTPGAALSAGNPADEMRITREFEVSPGPAERADGAGNP